MHRRLTRTPWALAVRGAAALAFGLLTLSRPTMTVSTFVALFAALAVCDGAATAAVAFRFRRRGADASAFADPLFLLGAGGAGIGAAALLSSDLTIRTLLTLVGAWAAVSGLGSLYAVSRGGERVPGWRLLAAAGVAGLALAAGVALAVAAGGVRVGWQVGAFGVTSGVLLLALAARLYVALRVQPRRRATDAPDAATDAQQAPFVGRAVTERAEPSLS